LHGVNGRRRRFESPDFIGAQVLHERVELKDVERSVSILVVVRQDPARGRVVYLDVEQVQRELHLMQLEHAGAVGNQLSEDIAHCRGKLRLQLLHCLHKLAEFA